jgi:hypothetical protein
MMLNVIPVLNFVRFPQAVSRDQVWWQNYALLPSATTSNTRLVVSVIVVIVVIVVVPSGCGGANDTALPTKLTLQCDVDHRTEGAYPTAVLVTDSPASGVALTTAFPPLHVVP